MLCAQNWRKEEQEVLKNPMQSIWRGAAVPVPLSHTIYKLWTYVLLVK